MVSNQVVTQQSADALKAYGTKQVSIADQLGIVVGRAILEKTIEQIGD